MRDAAVITGLSQIDQKVGHDVRMLHEQLVLCRMRIEAIEKVCFESRRSMLMTAVLMIFNPKLVQRNLDGWTDTLLSEYRKAERAALEQKKKGIIRPSNGAMGVIHP